MQLIKPTIQSELIYKTLSVDGRSLTTANMSPTDLNFIYHHWVFAENWTPLLDVTASYLQMDERGFYLLFVDGEPAVSLACVRFPELKIGFIGLYIAAPAFRGKGLGKILWDNVLQPLQNQGYHLGLNAALDKIEMYKNVGFISTYNTQIWHYDHTHAHHLSSAYPADNITLTPITAQQHAAVSAYDASIFNAARASFLSSWFTKKGTTALAAYKDGKVVGYGVSSTRLASIAGDTAGHRIGPLFADDANIAAAILSYFIALNAHRPLSLECRESETNQQLLQRLGFDHIVNLGYMLTNPLTFPNSHKIFAKTSTALAPT